ncbi:Rieske (2Fe-2S) protein [Serinicoccus kebangsaanensis]|uniref:Rieske (2Fe-2S) protein n=1 Tax=Serinicoccus kebangsaanensis TaxID=2602069 RepID=UPI00124E49E1|nr:Rieske (2Fe-2S) protein [Serinicoccus kebangsaanensis]
MTSPQESASPVAGCAAGCAGAVPGVARRRVLAAGGAVVAGSLGACAPGGGGEAPASSSSGSGAGTELRVALAEVPVGGSTYLSEQEVIVAQPTEGEVVAFDATCPHQGCSVSGTGEDATLVCPCHGSSFASADGSVVTGPATAGLTALTATLDGGDVVISG